MVSASALLVILEHPLGTSQAGFRIYAVQDNALLLSDDDIVSYNWTSQEISLTPKAAARLSNVTDLYSWTGFAIKIDGDEVYEGVFRRITMSAIPAPPRISILYPSVTLPNETENAKAMKMFYMSSPGYGDQGDNGTRIRQYFERTDKLVP